MSSIKVAIAQIHYKPCFKSDTHDFIKEPYGDDSTSISSLKFIGIDNLHRTLVNDYLDWLKIKLQAIISKCIELHVDLLVLPEYSVPAVLLCEIVNFINSSPITIIAGSHVVQNNISRLPPNYPNCREFLGHAISPVIQNSGIIGFSTKCYRSKWESTLRIPNSFNYSPISIGKCNIQLKICIDAISGGNIFVGEEKGILVVPSWSPTTDPFDAVSLYASYNEIPTLYVNCAYIGGSTISAAFEKHNAHWFISNNSTKPIPKNTEAIIIASIDLANMRVSGGTVIEHKPAIIDGVVNLFYCRSEPDKAIIDKLNNIVSSNDFSSTLDLPRLRLDELMLKKVNIVNQLNSSGLLDISKYKEVMQYIKINSISYGQFLLKESEKIIKIIGSNMDNAKEDNNIWANMSRISDYISEKSNKSKKTGLARFDEDDKLLIGRSNEFYEISQFFNSDSKILTVHGLRGIGKTKLLKRIKPQIIPENSKYELFYIELSVGCGYDILVDEILYSLGISSYGMEITAPEKVVDIIKANISNREKVCIVIDEINLLMGQDNEYIDERTSNFIKHLVSVFDGKTSKLIISSSRKRKILDGIGIKSFEVSRLDNTSIHWIIDYCCSYSMYENIKKIDERAITAIHGNPLAAIIISQLLVEHKDDELYDQADVFRRFEEQYIKNLIGELTLSQEEVELLQLLSVSTTPVDLSFIKQRYVYLVDAFYKLSNKFFVELSDDQESITLHPLIREFYYENSTFEQKAKIHSNYAKYYEEKISHIKSPLDIPPQVASNLIYHYGGSLQIDKFQDLKFKYVDRLKPIADTFFAQKNYEKALVYYKVMYDALGSARVDILLKLSQCYVYTDEIAKANDFFEMAISQKPCAAYLYAKFAIALASKYSNLHLAESLSQQAEEIYQKNPSKSMWELAEIKFSQAKTFRWTNKPSAIKLFKEACELEPTNCYYKCVFSRYLFNIGIIDEAKKYYIAAKEINPTYKALHDLYDKLFTSEKSRSGDKFDDDIDDADVTEPQ